MSTRTPPELAGPLLGLDYGRKRIGLAVGTALGTVHPRPRLERRDPASDLDALSRLCDEVGPSSLVLGLPHNMDGTLSDMEREVRTFARELGARLKLPVFGVDERLSTEAATERLRSLDLSGRERKAKKDSAAACLILEDLLAALAAPEPVLPERLA